jgi:poly-beta-1,6-N-acetyl-D-glucosamine synthase
LKFTIQYSPFSRNFAGQNNKFMSKTWLEILLWVGIFVVFYAYLGYGILLYFLVKIKSIFGKKVIVPNFTEENLPKITFIVCAFNEEDWMHEKIENCLAFDYPKDKITFFFVTDGSSDGTPTAVENFVFPSNVQWKLLHQPERRGKIAAFDRSMAFVETPIVISTDANTVVNRSAIRMLVRHFADEKVGAVAGEKRISLNEKDAASGAGEGIYWKYESKLKKWDSELWSVVGAAGELFAIRTNLYESVPKDTIIEDFYLTLRIASRGFRVMYEPEAAASEGYSANVKEELKRKIRIAAGGLQAISRLKPLLNPFKYGILSFQYISHRVLRWTLAPAFLPIIFFTNFRLMWYENDIFYPFLMAAQFLFYLAAAIGWSLEQREIKVKVLFVPYYFCVMNYAVYAGFSRFWKGKQSVLWERSERKK